MTFVLRSVFALRSILVVGLTACQGQIQPEGSSAPAAPYAGPRPDQPAVCLDREAPQFDDKPVRLLSRHEYNNTIRDLLQDDSRPLEIDPAGETNGYDNNAMALSIDARLAEHYLDVAEQVAARAMQQPERVLPCSPTFGDERECARQFIAEFGLRAFRHPMEESELAELLAFYDTLRETEDFYGAIEVVLQAILLSPQFLYHIELGEPTGEGTALLDDYEIASRLAYFLWNTMPDEELFRAAAAGELGTSAQIVAQASRMLDDSRARDSVAHFHVQWLQLDQIWFANKDAELFPEFDDELRADLHQETVAFLEQLVWEEQGTVASLFLSDFAMVNERTAALYDIAGVDGDAMQRVSLESEERRGLLTQGSLLSIHAKHNRTSPVHRGLFVRDRLLCDPLPPPPNSVPPLPEVDAAATARERLAQHREDPACAGCHSRLDPIGFAFENYDAAGRYRTFDEFDRPIDASGEIHHAPGIEGVIDGVDDLSEALAQSDMVRECVTLQWFRYAMARPERNEDACALESLNERLAESGYRLRDLVLRIVESDAFRHRSVVEPEVCE